MSIPDGRPQTVPNRSRGILLGVASLLLLLVAGQILLQRQIVQRTDEREAEAFVDTAEVEKLSLTKFTEMPRTGADWPQWRGPNRDGVLGETGLLTSWPADGPRRLWEAPVGQGFSAPVVSQGRVYALFLDKEQENVVCWNAEDGAELWRFRYPAAYSIEISNGPRSTPAIDGDRIYTVGGVGMMHCLSTNPQTPQGESVWSKDLVAEFAAPRLRWGVSSSPLVVGERVFIQPGGPDGNSLAALAKSTGQVLWKALDDGPSYSSPVAATLAGERQIVFFTAQNLVGVTEDKGEVLWRFPWVTNSEGCNIATPIVVQDYVFISSGYGKGCALVKIDKSEEGFRARKVYQNVKMRNQFSSSVRDGDALYGFTENRLMCMDVRTGETRWKAEERAQGAVTIVDGHLLVLHEDGMLALAEASPTGYTEKARLETGLKRPCWTVPVVSNGRLFVRDQERLICFDLRK